MVRVAKTGEKKCENHRGAFCSFLGQFPVVKNRERKKHPKKICIKNFGGTPAGGSRRGLRRPNSLRRCWFSQRNTVHKEFRGGGLRGSWGWGLRSNFWAPFLYVYGFFWGLKKAVAIKVFPVSIACRNYQVLLFFRDNLLESV